MRSRKNGSGELLATTVWSSTGTQSSLAKARLLLRLIKGWTAPTFWKRREKFWVLIWLPARMTKSFARRIMYNGNQEILIAGKCIRGSLQRSLCLRQQYWWSSCSRGEKEGFELFFQALIFLQQFFQAALLSLNLVDCERRIQESCFNTTSNQSEAMLWSCDALHRVTL